MKESSKYKTKKNINVYIIIIMCFRQHHRVTCPPAVQKKVKGGSRQFSALTDAPSTVPPPKQNDKLLRRQNLPAWNAQEQICTLVRDNPVVM